MITKQSVFAQAGQRDPARTDADFRNGMIPKTVAMAEDVNTYGNWSDRDLKVVCDEIVNALKGQGINPNNSYLTTSANQLDTLLKTKLSSGFKLTGLIYGSNTTMPTQSGASISFPSMKISFNKSVYYGSTQNDTTTVTISARTITADSTWSEGPNYIYATSTGAIRHQDIPVQASDGATSCFLGSVFVQNGSFQPGSWKFQPWLQITSQAVRESPTATRKGGYVSVKEGAKLQMGALEIMSEGINFAANPLQPSIMSIPAKSPFTYKYLYPSYDAGASALEDVDTKHIYDMSTETWVDISGEYAGKYICIVPCITPTGETLMIPAMSYYSGGKYTSVFDSVSEATSAVYGLQYKLNKKTSAGTYGADVTSRCIYLGQTLIVKVGATDLTDSKNFASVGQVPQALAGFTEASGQTGGGAGAYIPMPEIVVTDHFTTTANTSFVVQGRTDHTIIITMPDPQPNIINQFQIKYTHSANMRGLEFSAGTKWWGDQPSWIENTVYNIIFEYVNGSWIGGFLSRAA